MFIKNLYNAAKIVTNINDRFRQVIYNAATSLIRPENSGPKVTGLDRFHCIIVLSHVAWPSPCSNSGNDKCSHRMEQFIIIIQYKIPFGKYCIVPKQNFCCKLHTILVTLDCTTWQKPAPL